MADERSQVVASMPLHAITAVYGEEGLRERLRLEIERFAGEERQRIDEALALAAGLHSGDRRGSEPYVNHLLRVATRIICYYGVYDPDVVCAALLHDAVEDHPGDLAPGGGRDEALAVLAGRFGGTVASLVAAVTNPEREAGREAGRDKNQQYREHVAESLRAHPLARVIKASDFTDNGVGLIHATGPMLQRLAAKYAPLVPVLEELISRADTPLRAEVKAHIMGQLEAARQRFAAIMSTA